MRIIAALVAVLLPAALVGWMLTQRRASPPSAAVASAPPKSAAESSLEDLARNLSAASFPDHKPGPPPDYPGADNEAGTQYERHNKITDEALRWASECKEYPATLFDSLTEGERLLIGALVHGWQAEFKPVSLADSAPGERLAVLRRWVEQVKRATLHEKAKEALGNKLFFDYQGAAGLSIASRLDREREAAKGGK